MLALLLTIAAVQLSPCAPDEAVVLSCPVKKKQLAVCAGPATKPTWLQYRFGPAGKPELVFPAEKNGFAPFTFERRDLVNGTSTTLTFTRGGTIYEVWLTEGRDAGAGVNVLQGEKMLATVACTGAYQENWSLVEDALKAPPAAQTPPDPLAGRSMKEICNDDGLLLLKAPWEELSSGGFARLCCNPKALGEDDERCNLDWPSSDVPSCRELDLLRNRVFALYGYSFKDPKYQAHFAKEPWYRARADFQMSWVPAVGQKNSARLKDMTAKKQACVDDAPPQEPTATPEACRKAGTRFSLDQFKMAKGHMDGVQQSEIGDALFEQCLGTWPASVTACLVAGKGDPCLAVLSEEQREQLWKRVNEIAPE